MPDTSTTTTATNAETRAAGTKLLGFILGGGSAIVDKLIDVVNFVLKDADGNVAIGAAAPANTRGFDRQLQIEGAFPCVTIKGTTGPRSYSLGANADGNFEIWDNDAAAVRMMLGSNGNLGIGPFAGPPAVRLNVASTAELVRLTTTKARGGGDCFSTWHDPSGVKGYFGFASGANDQLYLLSGMNAAMLFGTNNLDRWQITAAGNFEPIGDNTKDAGHASARIKTIHLVNSPSVTSDEREKDWRGAPTEAELRAAKRIAADLGFYRWKTEPDGPLRFGARAQKIRDILADEGLLDGNPARYGLLGHHEWTDAESGEARDRYSLDPDQLALFLIAAQEARLAALESA